MKSNSLVMRKNSNTYRAGQQVHNSENMPRQGYTYLFEKIEWSLHEEIFRFFEILLVKYDRLS